AAGVRAAVGGGDSGRRPDRGPVRLAHRAGGRLAAPGRGRGRYGAGAWAGRVAGLAATLALVCVLQLGQAVAGPAWGALIPRIVGDDLVGRATGTGQALSGLAMLAGSAAGGVLVGWFGGPPRL